MLSLFRNATDVYNNKSEMMKSEEIKSFRKILRSFERLIEYQNKSTTCCNGVSIAQCHALLALSLLGSCSVIKLAEHLGLDKSTVSRTVEGLVRIGLVNRETDHNNRRYSILTLTSQGKKTVRSINYENNLLFKKVFSKLPPEKIIAFLNGFELFTNALKDELLRDSCLNQNNWKD